jgi:hypothetical protein
VRISEAGGVRRGDDVSLLNQNDLLREWRESKSQDRDECTNGG